MLFQLPIRQLYITINIAISFICFDGAYIIIQKQTKGFFQYCTVHNYKAKNNQSINYQVMHQQQQQNPVVLYEDGTVKLTSQQIIIKRHFFPFILNKSISYHQINDVYLLSRSIQSRQNVVSYLNPFGPTTSMYQRVSYIELWIKDSKSRPNFAPDNPQIVFNIIKNQLRNEQMKENINLGIDNATKTIEKGYQGVMSKIGKFVEQATNKISQKGHQLSQQFLSRGR